jgi:hypothetical protein
MLKFFRWYCHPGFTEDIEGDLVERFEIRAEEQGVKNAKWHFAKDVLRLFRPGIVKSLATTQKLNQFDMILHNLKIGYRNLLGNKGYSYINIGGLAVGIAVSILIGLWVQDELAFNQVHQNHDRIAQVMQHQNINNQIYTEEAMPLPIGDEMRVKYSDDFDHVVMSTLNGKYILSNNKTSISQTGRFMEAGAPHLLTLEMESGTRGALKDPTSILLSEVTAKALFGNTNH